MSTTKFVVEIRQECQYCDFVRWNSKDKPYCTKEKQKPQHIVEVDDCCTSYKDNLGLFVDLLSHCAEPVSISIIEEE